MDYNENGGACFSGPIIAIGREEVVLDNENSKTTASGKRSHGFHLVRSKWDPYPWIGSVESASSAELSGLRSGDCLLGVDSRDVLGLEMKDIAYLIGKNDRVSLSIWRRPPKSHNQSTNVDIDYLEERENRESLDSKNDHTGTILEGPLPEVARKLVRAVSGVVKALECPVCLESAAPPVAQCVHGHLLCAGCRTKTSRCPVCRVRLGHGRCLLADKSHRVLTDALVDPLPAPTKIQTRSLHDSIFGASPTPPKQQQQQQVKRLVAKQLLSKLLSPGSRSDERNASTESLPTDSCAMDGNLLYGRRWLLRLYDRRKSASTGELNKPDALFSELRDDRTDNSGSLLSVPQTPVWGGSTESMIMNRLSCPLKKRAGCNESVDCNTLIQHLAEHHLGPLVHFYKKKIILPLPFPFQEEAVYILHQREEIFTLQNDNGTIWISCCGTNSSVRWEWIFYSNGNDGTEVHVRREVISLREPFELLPRHIVILPGNFAASSVTVSLIEITTEEGYIKL